MLQTDWNGSEHTAEAEECGQEKGKGPFPQRSYFHNIRDGVLESDKSEPECRILVWVFGEVAEAF